MHIVTALLQLHFIKCYNVMKKIPYLEVNCIPSQLNTSSATGVASQLANVAKDAPQFDGVTIEQMRGNPLYGRGDKIDKIGAAQRSIADATKVIKSRSRVIRQLNDAAQRVNIPNSNSKK